MEPMQPSSRKQGNRSGPEFLKVGMTLPFLPSPRWRGNSFPPGIRYPKSWVSSRISSQSGTLGFHRRGPGCPSDAESRGRDQFQPQVHQGQEGPHWGHCGGGRAALGHHRAGGEEVPPLPLLPRSRPFPLPGKRDRVQAQVLLLRGGGSGVEQERELLPVPRGPFGRHRHVGGAAVPAALRALPAPLDRAPEGRLRALDLGQWIPLQQLVPSPWQGPMRLCRWRWDQQ